MHLVRGKKDRPVPPNTRITMGRYIADILLDTRQGGIYHWIIQRTGSAEIINWNQERSFEAAESAARECLEALVRRDNQKKA